MQAAETLRYWLNARGYGTLSYTQMPFCDGIGLCPSTNFDLADDQHYRQRKIDWNRLKPTANNSILIQYVLFVHDSMPS